MAPESAYAYLDRALGGLVTLLFVGAYCATALPGRNRPGCGPLRHRHLKVLAVCLFLLSALLSLVGNAVLASVVYSEGMLDTCVRNCSSAGAGVQCTVLPPEDCPLGIVARPFMHYATWRAQVALPAGNAVASLALALRTSGVLAVVACLKSALGKMLRSAMLTRTETRAVLAYAVAGPIVFLVIALEPGREVGRRVAIAYVLHGAELVALAGLLAHLRGRVGRLLDTMPRNYRHPSAPEATLLFIRAALVVLAVALLLEATGLLGLGVWALVYEPWDAQATGALLSQAMQDLLSKAFALGAVLVPVVGTLVIIRPSSLLLPGLDANVSPAASHFGGNAKGGPCSRCGDTAQGFSSSYSSRANPSGGQVGAALPNEPFLFASPRQVSVPLGQASARRSRFPPKHLLHRTQSSPLREEGNVVQVSSDFSGAQGEYLLNALLKAELRTRSNPRHVPLVPRSPAPRPNDTKLLPHSRLAPFIPVSEAIAQLDAQERLHSGQDNANQGDVGADRPGPSAALRDVTSSKEAEEKGEEDSRFREYTLATEGFVLARRVHEDDEQTICSASDEEGGTPAEEAAEPPAPGSPNPWPGLHVETAFLSPNPGEEEEEEEEQEREREREEEESPPTQTSPPTRFWQQSKYVMSITSADDGDDSGSSTDKAALATARQVSRRGATISKDGFKRVRTMLRGGGRNRFTGMPARELSRERRVELATLWLQDALDNREPKVHRLRRTPLRVYRFLHSRAHKLLVYALVAVQMMGLPFLEPTSTLKLTAQDLQQFPRYDIAVYLDLAFTTVFLLDALATLYAFGAKALGLALPRRASHTAESTSFKLRLAVALGNWVNVLVALADRRAFRLDRYTRWLTIVFVSKTVHNVVGDLIATSSHFGGVIGTYLFVITIYGLVGIVVFDPVEYANTRDSYWGNETDTAERMYRTESFPWMSINLYTVTTLEGFPDVLWPAYTSSAMYTFATVYWLSFLVINILLLQSIAVPLVYEPLQHLQRERLMRVKIAERKALVAAFEVLDEHSRFYLDIATVSQLVGHFSTADDCRIIMRLLDEDNNGRIDLLEFFQIVDALKLRITIKREAIVPPVMRICGRLVPRRTFTDLKNNATLRRLGFYLTLLMLCSLMLYRLVDLVVIVSVVSAYVLFNAGEAVVLVLSGSFAMSSWRSRSLEVLHVVLLSVEIPLLVAFFASGNVVVFNALQLIMIVHVYRVVVHVGTLSKIAYVLSKMRGILATILMVVFCIMYGYTIFGMDAFSRNEHTTHPSQAIGDFGSFPVAFITVFQLLTGENWNAVFYINSRQDHEEDLLGWWLLSVGYFFSFNLLVNLYILSIVLAIFLDAFLVLKDRREDTVSWFVDDAKAQQVLGVPDTKFVLLRKCSLEETLYEDFLEQNAKNTIQELLDLGILRNEGALREFTTVDEATNRPVFDVESLCGSPRASNAFDLGRTFSCDSGSPEQNVSGSAASAAAGGNPLRKISSVPEGTGRPRRRTLLSTAPKDRQIPVRLAAAVDTQGPSGLDLT